MTKKMLYGALVIAGCAFVVGCGSDPEVAKREYLKSGKSYVEQKKYNEAIVELRRALQEDTRFGEARRELALAYEAIGDSQNAYREFVRAADSLPDDTDLQLRAGQYLLNGGQFQDAKARAERVLARDLRNIKAQLLLGNALSGLRNFEGALKTFDEASKLDPASGETVLGVGAMQYAMGDLARAEQAFKNALSLAPQSIDAHLALASFYWSSNKLADAERLFKEAVALEPKDPGLNRAMSLFFLLTGRPLEAESYMRTYAEVADDKVTARLTLADFYASTGRTDEARKVLTPLSTEAGGAPAILRLAEFDDNAGRRPQAHAAVDGVLAKDPKSRDGHIIKGRLLLKDRKVPEAIAQLKEAVAIDPRSTVAYYGLGLGHVAAGDPGEATKAFNEVLKLAPMSMAAMIQLARLDLERGDAASAAKLATTVVATLPRNADAHELLGRALMAQRDLPRAEAELRTAIAQAPQSASALIALGELQQRKRDTAGAAQSFTKALALQPRAAEALQGLIQQDLAAGRRAQAVARVEAQLAKYPTDPTMLLLAGMVYDAAEAPERAEGALMKLIDVQPASLDGYSALGRFYAKRGKLDEALQKFENGLQRNPNSVALSTFAGMILELKGRRAEAQKHYEHALQLDPQTPLAANNLALIYVDNQQDLNLALQYAQTAKAGLPDRPEINDTLGWVFYKKGLSPQAIQAFNESVAKAPANAIYHYHLGLAYAQGGDKDAARTSLQKALSLKSDFDGAGEAKRVLQSLGA